MPSGRKGPGGTDPVILSKGIINISQDGRRGFIAYKWPRKRGPRGTDPQLAARDNFKLATQGVNQVAAPFVDASKEIAKRGGFTWKDRTIQLMYGRGVYGYTVDGKWILGWRDMSDNAQALLDSISTQIGSILVRTSDGWQALVPGDAGTVITSLGGAAPPDYRPSAGGGGAQQRYGVPVLSGATSGTLASGTISIRSAIVDPQTELKAVEFYSLTDSATPQVTAAIYTDLPNAPDGSPLAESDVLDGVVKGINRIPFTSSYTTGGDPETLWFGLNVQGASVLVAYATDNVGFYSTGSSAWPTSAPSFSFGTANHDAGFWLSR